MESIEFKILTESNLFIGGTPRTFEIGGIDLHTVTDYQDRPLIPASSIKGIARSIVRDLCAAGDFDAEAIKAAYAQYFAMQRRQAASAGASMDEKRREQVERQFDEVVKSVSAEALFGTQGFNRTPKLLFHDLVAEEPPKECPGYFSIDSKNTIVSGGNSISANPRTYRAVRPGVTFCGKVDLYGMEELAGVPVAEVRAFVERALLALNDGVYRIGNSGSRGYGKVRVTIVEEAER